ncbi:MAG: tetratricopeptide repeat protein, partial [Magnetococcales bacterium]|nr:tetratricopeptide repeat protein [Magnetococcales bacterium]
GQVDSAVGVLETVLGETRTQESGGDVDVDLLAMQATAYQRNGQHHKAIDVYEKILRKHPEKGTWWMGMAISLEQVKELHAAIQAYQSALESNVLSVELRQFVAQRIQSLSN